MTRRWILAMFVAAISAVAVWAEEPGRLPSGPTGFFNKLLGRAPRPPAPLPVSKYRSPHAGQQQPSDVRQASHEERAASPASAAPPPPRKSPPGITSWFRPRRASRTLSEYMAEERP